MLRRYPQFVERIFASVLRGFPAICWEGNPPCIEKVTAAYLWCTYKVLGGGGGGTRNLAEGYGSGGRPHRV